MREWGKEGVNGLVEDKREIFDASPYGLLDKNIKIHTKREKSFNSFSIYSFKTGIIIAIVIISAFVAVFAV